MSAYAELAVTTNFSFLRGASTAEELVLRAKELGLIGIGIADRNSVAGVVRAHAMENPCPRPPPVQQRLSRPSGLSAGSRRLGPPNASADHWQRPRGEGRLHARPSRSAGENGGAPPPR